MPVLSQFDPRPAVNMFINEQCRRIRDTTKADKQSWLKKAFKSEDNEKESEADKEQKEGKTVTRRLQKSNFYTRFCNLVFGAVSTCVLKASLILHEIFTFYFKFIIAQNNFLHCTNWVHHCTNWQSLHLKTIFAVW